MKIKSPHPYAERIMIYGSSGVGKSKAYVDIIRSQPDSNIFIVDNENAATRMLGAERDPRITIETGTDWESVARATLKAANKSKAGDWIIIDMMSPVWESVWMYFVHKAYRVAYDEMLFWMPTDKQRLDWTQINSLYNSFTNTILNSTAHFLGLYGEKEVIDEGKWQDKGMTLQMFGDQGFKPTGNKKDPHLYHTVIRLVKAGGRNKRYYMTTLKERERGLGEEVHYMQQKEWTNGNFAKTYLVEEAGWKVPRRRRAEGGGERTSDASEAGEESNQ